ncbi:MULTISPECIES: DUF4833 domain-containing protein [Shimia]|uniref:DUF4833 domain-containing protein n=1 Tax=Shimia TaxID=573139 RepID=UPI001FB50C86|nr:MULTISPECIES: DUF4833 domain-containing protein [Shimia]MDV4146693.1 DUF4833 domain-containing protein [Shimia sp. FJ5]
MIGLSPYWLLRQALLLGCILLLCTMAPHVASADPSLDLIESKETKRLPVVQPKWPRPNDAGQVFYIQRSMNPNTVVYRARYDASGDLISSRPLDAYWRRYAEEGQTRRLKVVERLFAYGISARALRSGEGFAARFAALPKLAPELRQEAPFKSALWVRIQGREYRLIYGYLDLDESGLIAKVVRLRLFTFDPKKDAYVTHMISVSGGDIRQ